MQKDLKIRISIDKKTGELKVVNGELGQIANTAQKTNQSVNLFGNSLMSLGAKVGGLYLVKEAFDAVLKTGFAFNKNMEDSIAGLTALTVATSSNISAMGKHLSIAEKYNLAQKEAAKTAKELLAINSQTPHSLEQTTQIYKTMYVSMKKVGASNKDMIEMTKLLSVAANAGNIEFNSLLAGVDGLATGTVLANSDLGRFLSSLGLTNEALKKTKDVVGLVKSKLGQLKVLDTMTVAVSNFDTAWQGLTGSMTKELFNDSKDGIKDLTKIINDNKADIIEFGLDTIRTDELVANGFEAIYLSSTLGYKELAYTFKDEIGSAINFVIDELQTTNNWWADTWIGKKAGLEKMNLSNIRVDANKLNEEIAKSKKYIYDLGKESDILLHKILTNTQAQKDYNKEAKKGKTDELVKTKNEPTVDNKSIEKQNAQQQKAYSLYTSIMGTGYDKWLQDTNEKLAQLGESGAFTSEQLQGVYDVLQQDYEFKITIKGIDEAREKMDKMYDSQIDLIQTGMDWGNSLKDTAKDLANVSKAIKQYSLIGIKSEKILADFSMKYTRDWLTLENSKLNKKEKTKKQDELYIEFKKDTDKQQLLRHQAEIGAYANLAGAMSGFFKEGSAQAKAFQKVQATLGIVNGLTAIQGAWALTPFPTNLPAVAATTAAVLPLIAQLTSLGGSGSAGGSGRTQAPSRQEVFDKKASDYADSVKPITDRLDRQIELLQTISGYGGSAIALELAKAQTTYKNQSEVDTLHALGKTGNSFRDANNWRKTLSGYHIGTYQSDTGYMSSYYTDWKENQHWVRGSSFSMAKENSELDRIKKLYGKAVSTKHTKTLTPTYDYATYSGDIENDDWRATLNDKYLSDSSHYIDFITKLKDNNDLNKFGITNKEYKDIMNQAEKTTHDFAMSIISSYQTIFDAGKGFKDDYDKLFGNYYKNKALAQAQKDANKLRGGQSLQSYLKDVITTIDSMKLTKARIGLLQSENEKDLPAKIKLEKELSNQYGKNVEAALNYKDSIGLVADAMSDSKSNIKSFKDSFKSKYQLLQDEANNISYTKFMGKIFTKVHPKIAKTNSELQQLFEKLKGGVGGLTNAELDFLQANKDLIDSFDVYKKRVSNFKIRQADEELARIEKYKKARIEADKSQIKTLNETEKAYKKILDSTKKSMDTIANIRDSLKSTIDKLRGVGESDTSLGSFNKLILAAIKISKGKDYKATDKAVKMAIAASSSLFDAKNFRSKQDMEFSQKVAANKFESIDTGLKSQYDVLKQIEINTSNQIAATVSSISSLQSAITGLNSTLRPQETYSSKLTRLNQNFGDIKSQREIYAQKLGLEHINASKDWTRAGGNLNWFKNEALSIRRDAKALLPVLGGGYTIDYNGNKRTLDTLSHYGRAVLGDSNTHSIADLVAVFGKQKDERERWKKTTGNGAKYLDKSMLPDFKKWTNEILDIRDIAKELIQKYGKDYTINYKGNIRSLETLSTLGKYNLGFSSGGYTGDSPINNVVGVVHGQEYVIDAPTTKDLGINGNGGVFKEIVDELVQLRKVVERQEQRTQSIQVESIKQTKILSRIDNYNEGVA